MEQNSKTPADYIDILKRRKYYIIVPFLLISITSVIVAYNLPVTFRSTATLLMEVPTQNSLIQSAIGDYASDQIGLISLKVMTADNLLSIIRLYDLYKASDKAVDNTILTEWFKRDTEISLVKSSLGTKESSGSGEIAFAISFTYSEDKKAKDIASKLATLFVEYNDRSRTQRATRAADFLAEESDKLNNQIQVIDSKISEYKKQYKDNLPEQLQWNLSTVERKEDQLRDTESQIRAAKERITFITAEMARSQENLPRNIDDKAPLSKDEEIRALHTKYLRLSSQYYPSHPDVVGLKRQIENLDPNFGGNTPENDIRKQLAESKEKLKLIQNKYASNHPDIIKLNTQIDMLQQRLRNVVPQSSHEQEVKAHGASPASLILEVQIKSSQEELQMLMQKRDELKATLEKIKYRVSLAPDVEKGYVELLREREHTLNKYNQLKEKLLDAKLVQKLEENQYGQTLTIIEQPIVPTRPEKASRRKVAIGGFFLAIAVGLASALFVEFMDPRVRGY